MVNPEPANPTTPAALGYALPAEWEPHAATWLTWPHNAGDWPGKFEVIPWVYGEMIRKISAGENVRLIVRHQKDKQLARHVFRRVGVDSRKIQFVIHATNRSWTRDTGPIFLRKTESGKRKAETAIVHFHFNGWAKYGNWRKDTKIPETAAKLLGKKLFHAEYEGNPIVIEGGGIEVNGRGTLLSTEECYLDPKIQVRNPGLGKTEIETALKNYLVVKNIFWLAKGPKGDDTHGHIDDICRFVNAKMLVLVREKNPRDENYRPLAENWERIKDLRLEDGASRKSWSCRCRRRCILTACGCRRATRIFTSATPPSSSRPSTTRTTASRSAFWANCSATVPSWASTPWIWSWASARCTASRSSSRRKFQFKLLFTTA